MAVELFNLHLLSENDYYKLKSGENMKKYLNTFYLLVGLIFIQSCSIPGVVSTPSSPYPQSVTETHTKTTIVSPPSYQIQALPQGAFYQSGPSGQINPITTQSAQLDHKLIADQNLRM